MTAANLRTRIEQILLGAYGVPGYAIPIGRFHLWHADVFEGAAERRARVELGPRAQAAPGANLLDSFSITERPVRVIVEYQHTKLGDLADGVSLQLGAGDLAAVENRAAVDQHLIDSALLWYEHWSGLDPYLIAIYPVSSSWEADGEIATLVLEYRALERASVPGSYLSP